MSRARSIRRAQAIHPYGPGAILDLGQESFVVLDTGSNAYAWQQSEKIRLPRLEARGRANAPDGFRLPPLMSGDKKSAALTVQRFPAWLFCPKCRRMWHWGRDQEHAMNKENQELPRCRSKGCLNSILVPMRYVAACSKGHLMDVDWWRWAHSRKDGASGSCDPTDKELEFISNGTAGSSLKSLVVKCRKCKHGRDLDDLQRADSSDVGYCSGRQPWQAFANRDPHCKGRVSVLLRSQTSVHYADLDSALDLEEGEQDRPPELDQWLRKTHGPTLDAVSGMEQVEAIIPAWATQAASELGRPVTNDEVREALERIFASSKEGIVREEDPMLAEWEKLSRPSPEDNIHAPLRVVASEWNRQAPDTSPIFGLIGSLMLVERLREVRALKGFTRVDPPGIEQGESQEERKERLLTPDLRRVSDPEQRRWKPAIEVFGEGLFIGFPENSLQTWEKENAKALERRFAKISGKLQDPENWVSTRFGSLVPVLPRFVLVHTFSHIFMRQLSYESGYNAASIRERLYVFPDKAGILIYTADGDSEGSLGGLVRQGKIDRAPNTINAAIERAAWCSNDPICMEMPENGLEGLNHASCHACSLAPETSCSHLNTLLDRQLVTGDGDGISEPRGYFTSVLETL